MSCTARHLGKKYKCFFNFQIFARGQGASNPPDALVFDGDETFGVGANVQTILYNNKGEVTKKTLKNLRSQK